jgi:ATP-dependent HslUV protease subunit HslV
MTARERRPRMRATTILGVRAGGRAAMGGDGQVTVGDMILKHNARKVRRLYNDAVLAGFAGAAADAFTLFEKFEAKLRESKGNLPKAAVDLAREWRSDRVLRRLEAQLAVVSVDHTLVISGNGELVEMDEGVVAIGSGGPYAMASARALLAHTQMAPAEVVRASLEIAARICLFTNAEIALEEL